MLNKNNKKNRTVKMRLTGDRNLDAKILSDLDDRELLSFCIADKAASEICNYEPFWMNRLKDKYPGTVKYFKDYSILFSILPLSNPEILRFFRRADTWKDYYLQTVYYVNKMKEDFDFDYKSGNPRDYYLILYGLAYPNTKIASAALLGYIDLLEHFNKMGGVYTVASRTSLFHGAAEGNQVEVINHFWKDPMSIGSARSGLIGAVTGGNIDLVKFFLSKGADNVESTMRIAQTKRDGAIISELEKHM